ncbi:MAG: hypothetical protein Q9168_008321, partial [Polycauliona sp. 1 TL-2023]
ARGETHFYLVTEISSQILNFNVSYLPSNGGLSFTPIGQAVWAYGNANNTLDAKIASGNAPAEIALTYLRNGAAQLIVSNRNATFFQGVKNPDPKNATAIVSDSLATFTLPSMSKGGNGTTTETVVPQGLTPAGGLYPRSFAVGPNGDVVAVGLQQSGRVVVFRRCVETGMIGTEVLAGFEGLGEVSSLIWDA